jgi:hypothetical protein
MRLALLVILAFALGGCGSTGQNGVPVRDDGVDRDKMAQVERAAERSGARVHWVNPPQKTTK